MKELFPNEIIKTLHPDDFMYAILGEDDKAAYFTQAEETIHSILDYVLAIGHRIPERPRVLDFGSGFGRITRYFVAAFGAENVTVCDLVPSSVTFCVETFGVNGFVSGDLCDLKRDGKYDLVFAGSVMTHLPPEKWEEILNWMSDHLAPDGIVIFTVAGPFVATLVAGGQRDHMSKSEAKAFLRDYENNGFAYSNYPRATEQNIKHGKSLALPGWVFSFLTEHTNLRLRMYVERGWWKRQDIYVVSQ